METSKHFVIEFSLHKESYFNGFFQFYGSVEDLIGLSNHHEGGFYLHNNTDLIKKLMRLEKSVQNTILIGITYAHLNLIETFNIKNSSFEEGKKVLDNLVQKSENLSKKHPFQLKKTIIMETAGMKVKRKEIIREELQEQLSQGFGVATIHL